MKSEVQMMRDTVDAIEGECLGWIEPGNCPQIADDGIEQALAKPVWKNPAQDGASAYEAVAPGGTVCVVVSDHTRKIAADRVLPVLIRGLVERGCYEDDIDILVASGIHRHPTDDDIRKIVGKGIYERFKDRIYLHDPDDDASLADVGTTSRGHPVRINRRAVTAANLVLLGGVVYHYHAGFGGGRKSLVPGLASRDTIAHNHSMTLDPDEDRIRDGVGPGLLDGNPVAEEMLESARMCNPAFIVNTVLDPGGRLAGVFAGDLDAAHRAACALAGSIYRYDIPREADLVVASAGTASNWVQSHKALYNASRSVKADGTIVLHAPCPEGLGDERFRYWLTRSSDADVFAGLRENPEVLGQTALSTRGKSIRTILATGLGNADLGDLGMAAAPDLPGALQKAQKQLAEAGINRPTYYVMPHARYTVPFVMGG